MFEFKVTASEGMARTGEFITPHGNLKMPVFMPVGTHGAVKSVSPAELEQIGSEIILGNTYHLYLRPGEKTVAKLGGIHHFMNWNRPILTDSGGFQVFSLGERGISGSEREPLRRVSEEGITFFSHLDGSEHFITPEKSIQIQQDLGADIIMAFDQPVYGLSTYTETAEAVERTHRWLLRSKSQWEAGDTEKQALFGIVQGGTHAELHTKSAHFVREQDFPGNAIGGLSVGESKNEMWEAARSIATLLPEEKPRYFMGLGGEPLDLIQATFNGIDMYDCVAPTRLARHGAVWELQGSPEQVAAFWTGDTKRLIEGESLHFIRLNLRSAEYREDSRYLSPRSNLIPDDLQQFSRGTLHHYLRENEILGYRVLTLHNLAVLHLVTEHMRQAIAGQYFSTLARVFGIGSHS